MIRYLTLPEVVHLHHMIAEQSGGATGIRDSGGLQSAVSQPYMAYGGQELYPTVIEKAAALGYSLVSNHPFLDGNKRIGHAALETFLILNGWELEANVDDQERVILQLAAGQMKREAFVKWVTERVRESSWRIHN